MTPPTDKAPRLVHNHGTEEGPWLACKEILIGECELRRLTARVQRLEGALRKYGEHYASCRENGYGCSCGLSAALAGGGEKEG